MSADPVDRREPTDRRSGGERRSGAERRLHLVPAAAAADSDQRADERRQVERRTGSERRLALPLVHQLRTVIDLLFQVSPERLVEGDRRRFEAAIFRLRYTLDRLDEPDTP